MSDGNFNNQRYLRNAKPLERLHRVRVLNRGEQMMTLVGDDLPALEARARRIVRDLRWNQAEVEVLA